MAQRVRFSQITVPRFALSTMSMYDQQVTGAGVLLGGLLVHSGIDLLNSSPGSLDLAVHL